MAAFNFADTYRTANLSPGPEIIRLRQEPFDKLRKELDAERIVALTRLYYGLPGKEPLAWFSDAFAETDPSFSMLDNEREAAVLAECLIAAGLEDELIAAGLALLTTEAGGNRQALIGRSNLVSKAREMLQNTAVAGRQRNAVDPDKIRLPAKSKIADAANTLAQASNWNTTIASQAAELFKQASDEGMNAIINLTNQVYGVILPMSQRLADLEEEVAMLWWYVGGWSQLLERPFSELDPALAAGMAGLDLAALTLTPPGPVAALAILQRLLSADRKGKSQKVSIQKMVDGFPPDRLDRVELSAALKGVADLCPALTAFRLAHELDDAQAWQAAFRKAVGFDAGNASFLPVELAMQVYREVLLVSLLDG